MGRKSFPARPCPGFLRADRLGSSTSTDESNSGRSGFANARSISKDRAPDRLRSVIRMRGSAGFILQTVRGGWAEDESLDRLWLVVLQHKCRAPARMRRSAGFILQSVRGGWAEDESLDRLRL